MTGFGFFGWIAAALQLIVVPSYAFRLVRRFGAHQVGWFLVTAFSCLAMLHLLGPIKPAGGDPIPQITLDILYAVGSVLLLLGMGHLETQCSERERARLQEENLRGEMEAQAKEEMAGLAQTNQQLIQEIARRDQLIQALEESEARYRSLFVENPQAMWILDVRTCGFLAVNQAALRQYGFAAEEFTGLTARDLVGGPLAADFVQDVAKPCPTAESCGLWEHRRKDGTLIDVEVTALDLSYGDLPAKLMLVSDVTERRRSEQESRETQRMKMIGQVAAGAARQFNTIFASIEESTSRLRSKPLDLKSTEDLEHIAAAVSRATGFTRQLLTAGSQHLMQLEAVDLNGLIRNMNPVLQRLIGNQVVLQTAYGELVSSVLGDRHLIEHIIINLVLNARDAMPQGGMLGLHTGRVLLENVPAETNREPVTGDFIRLGICDTGCGMTPEVQAHLFEPFFTTRDSAKGLGLGLASVYGAVMQQSGWIEYTTEIGVGTEFRVFLPCAPTPKPLAQSGTEPGVPVVRSTVLLVEPEDRARSLARFVLDRHGYRVIEADCSATALLLWKGQGRNVDLLFTDLALPGEIDGRELAKRLRQNRPDLKVVYTSRTAPGTQQHSPEATDFLPKPYTPDKLLGAMRACLGRVD